MDLVRYVLIHELCHTLEHNHSSRFWTHLRQFEPKTDAFHVQMRESWKRIPAWAHPIQAAWKDFDSKSDLQDDLLTNRVRVPKTIMEGTAGI